MWEYFWMDKSGYISPVTRRSMFYTYWVDERTKAKCFFLYAKNLHILWSEESSRWSRPQYKEFPSDQPIQVYEMATVLSLAVGGSFDATKLSRGIEYKVSLVVLLKKFLSGWEFPVQTILVKPDGTKENRSSEDLMVKPKREWIQIQLGTFMIPEEMESITNLEFYVHERKGIKLKMGLVIKGVEISV
ncbi:lectin-like isoform X2 [Lycium barbarum]|uniref:lectin-like isoform X2 n=1 Tax=Lycium barbarum TaxID=112863 RepID=UPI00293F0B08|nr:lectin-like isoform X2 [Lycium barbarum]